MLMNALASLRYRQDLMLVCVLFMTIVLMIIPVPTLIVDALIAVNISLTVIILGVSVYLKRPDGFSTFPSIILFGTAFRLAISISTTRLILSEADAGEIIETFGTFVTAGNVIVGLVIFLIITTVQFLVITKGGERVAEVAARFVLDAMPGRQMSIDAEVRAGDLTPEEAKEARRRLDRENKFYGAMDGAMKFIKGDAIAGLIITAVNLLGGMAVGVLQHNLSVGEAIDVYSRLTIGDGLVAQIPALLMALCAGAVITRIADDDNEDLGSDITKQLTSNKKTLAISAVIIGLIGLVPGFPTWVFFILSAILIAFIYVSGKQGEAVVHVSEEDDFVDENAINIEEAFRKPGDQISVLVSDTLAERFDTRKYIQYRSAAERKFKAKFGFGAKFVGIEFSKKIEDDHFAIELESVPICKCVVPQGRVFAKAEKEIAEISGLDFLRSDEGSLAQQGGWIPIGQENKAIDAAIITFPVEQLIVETAFDFMADNVEDFLDFADAQQMLKELQKENPELSAFIGESMSPMKLLDILRRLAREEVSVGARRLLFRAISENVKSEEDPALLTEMIRQQLRRQICNSVADQNRVIAAYIVEPELELKLREAINRTETGDYLMMSPELATLLLNQIEKIRLPGNDEVKKPVLITATDLRRHLFNYLNEHQVRINVMSFQEVTANHHIHPIGTLGVTGELNFEHSETMQE